MARASAFRRCATNCRSPGASRSRPTAACSSPSGPGRVRVFQNGALLAEPALTLDRRLHARRKRHPRARPASRLRHEPLRLPHLHARAWPTARARPASCASARPATGSPSGVVLLDDVPAANIHDGSRREVRARRPLYVTFGDVATPSTAQDLASLNGKILRLNDDGTAPAGNPFGSPVYSYGHRNPQGIDWHPVTGELWETEHGQTGNDEINVIDRGAQLRLAGDRRRRDARRHGDAGDVLRAGDRAFGRVVLPRHGDPGFRQQPVRRDAARQQRCCGSASMPTIRRACSRRSGCSRAASAGSATSITGPDGALYLCTSNRDGRNAPSARPHRSVAAAP